MEELSKFELLWLKELVEDNLYELDENDSNEAFLEKLKTKILHLIDER